MGTTTGATIEPSLESVQELQRENAELKRDNKKLAQKLQELHHDLKSLKQLLYAKLRPGVSRFDDSSPGQQFLFGETPESSGAASQEAPEESTPKKKRSKQKPTGRQPLPPGLPPGWRRRG